MILPENPALAWVNMIGMACVVVIGALCALTLHAVGMTSLYSGLCFAALMFIACLFVIKHYCPSISQMNSFVLSYNKFLMVACGIAFVLLIAHFLTVSYDVAPTIVTLVVNDPKPTGSMSYPEYGVGVLILAAVMLFTMDNFLGLGWVGLVSCGNSYNWDEAYAPLHRTIVGHESHPDSNKAPEEEMEVLIAEEGGGNGKEAEI
jgi:hypothetical protein